MYGNRTVQGSVWAPRVNLYQILHRSTLLSERNVCVGIKCPFLPLYGTIKSVVCIDHVFISELITIFDISRPSSFHPTTMGASFTMECCNNLFHSQITYSSCTSSFLEGISRKFLEQPKKLTTNFPSRWIIVSLGFTVFTKHKCENCSGMTFHLKNGILRRSGLLLPPFSAALIKYGLFV